MAGTDIQQQTLPVESPESANTSKVAKLFQQLGISTDWDSLSHIEESLRKNPSLLGNMEADAKAAMENPSEKSRFELLYLKGYGQVVMLKDGRQMSFAEIAKLPEKEKGEILGELKRSERSAFNDYEFQAANQRIIDKKEVERAANHGEKKLLQEEIKIDTALDQLEAKMKILGNQVKKLMDAEGIKFLSDELQKVQSNPASSPIVQNLVKQGAKMEDIQSGKYNSTIESYIIVQNKVELTPKDPEKAKEFRKVVREMEGVVGVPPTPGNINDFLGSKVLGESREAVGTAMHELGKTGNYDRMTWDDEARTVIFRGKNGEEIRIDTVSIPPRLTKSHNGLSISYEKQPDNPELEGARQGVESARERIKTSSTDIQSNLRGAGVFDFPLERLSPAEIRGLFQGEDLASDLIEVNITPHPDRLLIEIREKRKNSGGNLTNRGLQYLEAILEERINMDELGMGSREKTVTHRDLETKIESLQSLKQSNKLEQYAVVKEELQKQESKLASIQTPGVEDFDRETTETLRLLVDLGYDELGQNNFEEVIEAMNLHNKGAVTRIELEKNPRLEENQKKSLRELALSLRERSGQGEQRVALQQLMQGLRNESFRAKYWNTPEKRAGFLYQKAETPSEKPSSAS